MNLTPLFVARLGQQPLPPPAKLVQFPQRRRFLLEHALLDQQQFRHFGGPRLVGVGNAAIVIDMLQGHPKLVLVAQRDLEEVAARRDLLRRHERRLQAGSFAFH